MWHVFSITFLDCQRYLRDWTLTLAIGTWAKDWNCQAMRLCPAGQWRKNGAVLQEDALSTGIAFRALKCQFVELLWLLSSVGAVRPRMFLWNINRLWAQSTVCLGMWSTTLWTWWCAKFTDYDYAVWAFSSAWIQQCFTDIFPHFHPPNGLRQSQLFREALPMREDVDSLRIFQRLLEKDSMDMEHSWTLTIFAVTLGGSINFPDLRSGMLVTIVYLSYSLKWPLHHTRSSSRNAS